MVVWCLFTRCNRLYCSRSDPFCTVPYFHYLTIKKISLQDFPHNHFTPLFHHIKINLQNSTHNHFIPLFHHKKFNLLISMESHFIPLFHHNKFNLLFSMEINFIPLFHHKKFTLLISMEKPPNFMVALSLRRNSNKLHRILWPHDFS